jgi:hypothetical protein
MSSVFLVGFSSDVSLEQLVDFPTRKENTLDLFFTTHPSLNAVNHYHP